MTGWLWVALLPPDEPVVAALTDALWVDDQGLAQRWVAWPSGARPHAEALRAGAALVDPAGPATGLVVQVLAPGREPLFDDPAVQELLRDLERRTGQGEGALSSLTRDSSHWAGALLAGTQEPALLSRLGPVRRGRLEAGFASGRRQVLHGTQRNGGLPWPATGSR